MVWAKPGGANKGATRELVSYLRAGRTPPPGRGYNVTFDGFPGLQPADGSGMHQVTLGLASLTRWFSGQLPFYACGKGAPPAAETGGAERYAIALRNSQRFEYIGVLEEAAASMRLLQHVLRLHVTPVLPHSNGCSDFVPAAADLLSGPRAARLRQELSLDTRLYDELRNAFRERVARLL